MSDQEEPFGENPFRQLAAGKFPQRKDAGRASGARATHAPRRPVAARSPEDAQDAELFLRAMSRVRPTAQGKGPGGFTLAERRALPEDSAAAAKKQRTAGAAAKERKPAPAEAHAARAMTGAARATAAAPPQLEAPAVEDEAAAFLQAVREATPLSGKGRAVAPAPAPGTPPQQGELTLQDFMDGKLEFALSFTDEYLEGYVVGLDPLILNKLRAGALSPEAHLDLHGLTVEQAFEALRGFLRGSWYKGLRTVLVVPGRGRNSPDGQGVLRGKLQIWLTQEPFKRVVLAFCTAQPHDGGPGSVYVLLRKYRKKGRVYWERVPADADLYRDS